MKTPKNHSLAHRIRHPYHLKNAYISWRLRLLKHVHTGRRVHSQHTSYPVLGLLLLSLAAVLAQSTFSVHAAGSDSVVVSAVVSGPVPTEAATIDTPLEDADFTATPITVTGTCPLHTYVQLFRNGQASGTAMCTQAGAYSIVTDLFSGKNELVVKTYNYANQPGLDSEPRHVTYTPPVVVTPPISGSDGGTAGSSGNTGGTGSTGSGGTTGGSASGGLSVGPPTVGQPGTTAPLGQPLLLRNDYLFRSFVTGQSAGWTVGISGGSAPYSVDVQWGDGTHDLYTSTAADTLSLAHTYKKANPDGGYAIIITASDAAGGHTTLQVLALVADPNAAAGSSSGGSTAGGQTLFGLPVMNVIKGVWTSYGIVCIILLSFWLGESRELRLVRTRFRLTRL